MRIALIVALLALAGCGLIDAFSSPTDDSNGTHSPGDCSSNQDGGCNCVGNECLCDDSAGAGCRCIGEDCVIESVNPRGCGTASYACFGITCRCDKNDVVTCGAGACDVKDAATQAAICSGTRCSCSGATCDCVGGGTDCCAGPPCS